MCNKDCANCKHGLDINNNYMIDCEEDGELHCYDDSCDKFEELPD